MVGVLGGLESVVPDIFGEDMRICSLREGVDSVLRSSLLRHRLATVLQPPWVPAFTSRGWEIAEVPGRLMGMINIARLNGLKMMVEEPCLTEAACFNCQKLLEDKRECSLPGCDLPGASWTVIVSLVVRTQRQAAHPPADQPAEGHNTGDSPPPGRVLVRCEAPGHLGLRHQEVPGGLLAGNSCRQGKSGLEVWSGNLVLTSGLEIWSCGLVVWSRCLVGIVAS